MFKSVICRWSGIAGLAALLAGCFDLNQSLIVKDSGEADFNFAFTLDAALLELSDEADIDAESTCDSDDVWDDLPTGLTRVSDVRIEGSQLVCEYTISGPLPKFEQLSADLERENHRAEVISLKLLDDHRAQISSVYNFNDQELDFDSDESPMAKSIKRMIAANFEGHFIRWAIHAPAILESNGEISPDGKTVTWAVPLEEAIMAGGEFRFEAVIDYRNEKVQFF